LLRPMSFFEAAWMDSFVSELVGQRHFERMLSSQIGWSTAFRRQGF